VSKTSDVLVEITLPGGAVAKVPWSKFCELVAPATVATLRDENDQKADPRAPVGLRPRAAAFLSVLLGAGEAGLKAEGLAAELGLAGVKSVSGEVLTTKHNLMEMGFDPSDYFSKDSHNVWRCTLGPTRRLLARYVDDMTETSPAG
jgi:hypothetical protein